MISASWDFVMNDRNFASDNYSSLAGISSSD